MRKLLYSVLAIVALVTVSEKLAANDAGQKKTMLVVMFHDTDIVRNDGSADPRHRRFVKAEPKMWRSEIYQGDSLIGWMIQNGCEVWQSGTVKGTAFLVDTSCDSARFILFGPPETEAIRELRFGEEIKYFARHSAKQLPDESVGSHQCEVYRVDTAKTQLTLWMNKATGLPLQLRIVSPIINTKYSMTITIL